MTEEDKICEQLFNSQTKQKGFNLLMKNYSQALYFQLFTILKNHDDTNDVLQNTFIKVWRYIDQFKRESKLSTWLYTIAKNESMTFLNQKNKLKTVTFETNNNDTQQHTHQDIQAEDILQQLEKAIATLPPKQQEVFKLRYYNEMKYSEMAQKLQTSESALKTSYHLAVKKIEAFFTTN